MAQNPCAAMNALQYLRQLHEAAQRERYPNVPSHARVKPTYSDKSANELTKAVLAYIRFSGGWATRVNSTGVFDERRQQWRTGNTVPGTPDIMGTLADGRFIGVEVKTGSDRQSDQQKAVEKAVKQSGGIYLVARSFQEFYDDLQHLTGAIPVMDVVTTLSALIVEATANHFIFL